MLFPKDVNLTFSVNMNDTVKKIKQLIFGNPEVTAACIAATVSLLRASKSIVVSHRVNKSNRRQDYTYYDPHTGFRWDLSRKLTNSDRKIITRLSAEGRDMYDILSTIDAIRE